MGKVLSMMTRPLRNYNVESRAHRVISKDKPTPAPKHQAYIQEADRLLRENPDSLNEVHRKHVQLDLHLKDVFVKSHDTELASDHENVDRLLPLNRRPVEDFEFGFQEPKVIPAGRCSLKQAVQFLCNHQADPVVWDRIKISTDYNLSLEKVENVLKYFQVYKVFVPDKNAKNVFAESSKSNKNIGENIKSFIGLDKSESDSKNK